MFMVIGNDKVGEHVKPTEILDLNQGWGVEGFKANTALTSITLFCTYGLKVYCKAQNYDEYLEMIKLSRQAVKEVI